MFSLQADNIYDVIQPLHYCAKFFGITCFTFGRTSTNKLNVCLTVYDIFWIVWGLLAAIGNWIMLTVQKSVFFKDLENRPVFNYWMTMVFFVVTMNPIVNIIWTILFRKKFEKIYNLMLDIDDFVRSICGILKNCFIEVNPISAVSANFKDRLQVPKSQFNFYDWLCHYSSHDIGCFHIHK